MDDVCDNSKQKVGVLTRWMGEKEGVKMSKTHKSMNKKPEASLLILMDVLT